MHTKSLAATLTGASLLVAGCGSSQPPTTSSSSSLKSPVTAAYRFSACMRSHGVTGFPDPRVISRPGEQAIGIHVTPALTGSPKFKTAQSACQGIMPGPNPAQQVAQQRARAQQLLAFARCVRAHGVTSFPDPTPQGQINPQMIAAAGVDLHAPGVIRAARACVPASRGAVTQAAISQATGGGGGP